MKMHIIEVTSIYLDYAHALIYLDYAYINRSFNYIGLFEYCKFYIQILEIEHNFAR